MVASAPRPPAWRVLIAGGGIPSLALALALRLGVGEAISVTVAEPGRSAPGASRAFALSDGSIALLRALGVWPVVEAGAQPITGMRITDSRLADAVRPEYLRFGDGGAALGAMIEEAPLAAALREAAGAAGVVFEAGAVADPRASGPSRLALRLGNEARSVSLLVAADGARSRLREAAGVGWVGRRYPQRALVATVSHARSHGGLAVQHFLPAGPFAILPLAGPGRLQPHRSSIVWTEEDGRARALLDGPDAVNAELSLRFGPELGQIALEGPLVGFPLSVGLARRFAADRVALLGDAAHEIHPLAGQGLNLGLADAAALAERAVDAVRLGLDPGGPDVLAAFERDRRFDAVLLASLTDGLNRLFTADALPVRAARDVGLGLVDRAAGLKARLAGEAAGRMPRAPRLMRGLPL